MKEVDRWRGITDFIDPSPYSFEIGEWKHLMLICDSKAHPFPVDAFLVRVFRYDDVIVGDSKKPNYELTIHDNFLGMKKQPILLFKDRPFTKRANERLVNKHEIGRGFIQPESGRVEMLRPNSKVWRKRWYFECQCRFEVRIRQERLVEIIFKVVNTKLPILPADFPRLPLTILN